ncbi:MAG: DUF2914 domain-containing protein [Candidatus Pacebacteria bacterium]|nr:DUF2914 domain-containing protein [Candidatus Paceibacterota bacterium]
MIRRYLPKNVKELVHWYERYVSPISLVAGFISDNLILLRRVDLWTTDALFIFYLVLSSAGILLINALEAGKIKQKFLVESAPAIPIVVQFAVGGLFSGFLSLYSRSAGYAASWIFVLIVAALLLGNERFARFYVRVPVQISILFTTLFAFLIFFLPVEFHKIGPWMFALSGATALVLISLFLALMLKLIPPLRRQLTACARAIAIIYLAFNALYFTSAIPPLPLSLKDAGVYHDVVHDTTTGDYVVSGEEQPWYDSIYPFDVTYHEVQGDNVFVYTSIFAPSGLSTQILHQWQYNDGGTWVTKATIEYPIIGGRDGGYEGYSEIANPAPGKWRVNVITQYGQLIGRISFAIVAATDTPELITATK